jgi:hypothetical protein
MFHSALPDLLLPVKAEGCACHKPHVVDVQLPIENSVRSARQIDKGGFATTDDVSRSEAKTDGIGEKVFYPRRSLC